ncbi:hypothetical protein EH220_00385 [bacterium]|nr:MAG: hypothetical protein EH220_00385 [bacterium]
MSQLDVECQETSQEQASEEKQVPVSEAIRYRKRAQAAERSVEELTEKLQETQQSCTRLQDELQSMQTDQALSSRLNAACVVDMETAILIAKSRMQGKEKADMDEVIAQLRRDKPFLFLSSPQGSMFLTSGAKNKTTGTHSALERAARQAAGSGNRRDVQEYLRVRRQVV